MFVFAAYFVAGLLLIGTGVWYTMQPDAVYQREVERQRASGVEDVPDEPPARWKDEHFVRSIVLVVVGVGVWVAGFALTAL